MAPLHAEGNGPIIRPAPNRPPHAGGSQEGGQSQGAQSPEEARVGGEDEPAVEVEREQGGREKEGKAPGEIAGQSEAEPEGPRAMKLSAKRQFNQVSRTPILEEGGSIGSPRPGPDNPDRRG